MTSFPVLYQHGSCFLVVLYPFYYLPKMLNAVAQVVCDHQREEVTVIIFILANQLGWISKFTKTKVSLS